MVKFLYFIPIWSVPWGFNGSLVLLSVCKNVGSCDPKLGLFSDTSSYLVNRSVILERIKIIMLIYVYMFVEMLGPVIQNWVINLTACHNTCIRLWGKLIPHMNFVSSILFQTKLIYILKMHFESFVSQSVFFGICF